MHLASLTASVTMLLFATTPIAAQRAAAAAEARTWMRTASAALARGDTLAAAGAAIAATRAWPQQAAYWWSAARYALLGGRRDQALDALATYTAMGGGWSLDDPALAGLADDPRAHELSRSAGTRVHRSLPFAEYVDRAFHPEGVAWDPRTSRLFLGSVRHGMVVTRSPDGSFAPFIRPGSAGIRAVFGIAVDTTRDLLWLTSGDVAEREAGVSTPRVPTALLAFSLKDATPVGRWEVTPDGVGHLLGDVVVAPDGRIWTTDSEHPGLYRVPHGLREGALEQVPITHPDWISLQGITFSADGGTAWIADWTTGLYRIDMKQGVVVPVTADPTLMTLGIDGLYRIGSGTLLAVQNGSSPARVIALTLDSTGTQVTRLETLDHHSGPGEPTLGVVTPEGFLFVATALWPFYDRAGKLDPAQDRPTAQVRRLPLP